MDIVKKYIDKYGLLRHQFESFHNFVYFGLQTVINDEPNIYSDSGQVTFSNIRFEKPCYMSQNKKKILTPRMAREKSLTYEFSIKIDVNYKKEKLTIDLCNIPAMVGSCVCNLYCKTPEEKISLGEIVGDRGGYFIINGKERVITGQTRKTYNRIICYKNIDNEFICETRSFCEETAKSSLIKLKYNSKKTNIELVLDNITTFHLGSVFNTLGYMDKLEELIGDDNYQFKEAIYFLKKNSEQCKINFSQVLPHLGLNDNFGKIIFLSKMCRKLILCESGILKEEDKSNLAYKRVDMVGILCKDLFKMLWKQFIKSLTKEMEKRKIGSIKPILDIKKKNIGINFYYCFSTGTWGIKKNNYKKLGVSEFSQNKVSSLTNLALLRKFNIPVGKKDKTIKIRQLHSSTIFYICPFETPEGSSVGTKLSLSTLSFVSLGMDFVLVKEILILYTNFSEISTEDINFKDTIIFLNGISIGKVNNPLKYIKELETLRENNILRFDVSFFYNEYMKIIEIWSDASRFMRPILNSKNYNLLENCKTIEDLERKNILVYRDPAELEYYYSSMEFCKESDYTEIHPSCIMGIVAAQIVFSNHAQSPRICYMSNMIKQAVGNLPTHEKRTDCSIYNLNYTQKPLNTTELSEIIGTDEFPNGLNVIVAVASYTGFNQEDSIIINKSAIERGLFTIYIKKTITTELKNLTNFEEIVCIPDIKNRYYKDYSKLDSNGIVKKGIEIKKGDIIIGKILKPKIPGKSIEDTSVVVKTNEEGVVDYIQIDNNIIKIRILQVKIPEIGDKFCSGMAQKGTCGMILSEVDMPFTSSGIVPDLIINPHCLPSRMTINQLMSSICSKARCISGKSKYKNGSPFSGTKIVEEACEELENYGLNNSGTEILYNGMTGEKIKSAIFIGPVFYHRLTHLVSNKIFAATHTNVKNKLTRQPLNGRSNDGGLRIGEMEKDCLLRHGIIKFSNERLMDLSDKYLIRICNICKGYHHVVKEDSTYYCNKCKSIDISDINIPYAAKLLVQELESLGLNITMIPEY